MTEDPWPSEKVFVGLLVSAVLGGIVVWVLCILRII